MLSVWITREFHHVLKIKPEQVQANYLVCFSMFRISSTEYFSKRMFVSISWMGNPVNRYILNYLFLPFSNNLSFNEQKSKALKKKCKGKGTIHVHAISLSSSIFSKLLRQIQRSELYLTFKAWSDRQTDCYGGKTDKACRIWLSCDKIYLFRRSPHNDRTFNGRLSVLSGGKF